MHLRFPSAGIPDVAARSFGLRQRWPRITPPAAPSGGFLYGLGGFGGAPREIQRRHTSTSAIHQMVEVLTARRMPGRSADFQHSAPPKRPGRGGGPRRQISADPPRALFPGRDSPSSRYARKKLIKYRHTRRRLRDILLKYRADSHYAEQKGPRAVRYRLAIA